MNYDVGNKIITKHKWRLVMVSLRRRRQCDDGWKWKSRFVQPSRNQFNYYNDVLILWHCHLRGEEWKTQIMNSTLAKDERTNERTRIFRIIGVSRTTDSLRRVRHLYVLRSSECEHLNRYICESIRPTDSTRSKQTPRWHPNGTCKWQ